MNQLKIGLLCGLLSGCWPSAAAQTTPNETLKQQYSNIQEWLKDSSKAVNQLQSFEATPLDRLFDWLEITRSAFSENWVNLSVAWQKRYTEAVRKRILRKAAAQFSLIRSYFHEKNMRWDEESINKNKAKTALDFIRTDYIYKINFRLLASENTWKLYDIRTETFRMIRDLLSGYDELISNGFSHEYIEARILEDEYFIIDNFNAHEIGDYPKLWGWRKKDDPEIRGQKIYFIQKDHSEVYLSSRTSGSSVALVKPFSYNIKEYPYLSWRWRVREFPNAPDTPLPPVAEVVVIFYQNWIGVPVTIHYVWNPYATPCSIVRQKGFFFDSYSKIIRTESSPSNDWFTENVNPFEDYQRIFGQTPPEQIIGIYLVTEPGGSLSTSRTDFDDFLVRKTTSAPSCAK